MTEQHRTELLKTDQGHIRRLKTYIFSKESSWFWISLASIFAFFIFSWITSDNTLVLFIKRAATLIFAFLIPGYLITKTIYPEKNEINVIEQFAFSVALSITFIMFTSYFLNIVWAITPSSLAITTFLFVLIFAFTALSRAYRYSNHPKTENRNAKIKNTTIPLFIIVSLAFLLYSYVPLASPIVATYDPYTWMRLAHQIIFTGHLPIFYTGEYPMGFASIIAFLAIFSDVRTYDVCRFLVIFPFLTIIPVYLLTYHIFKSKHVSFLTAVLMVSTKFFFVETSFPRPKMMVHFFLILLLFMLLKTLENPSKKNSLITSLFLSSTALLYHFELIILAIFIPSIFLFSYISARVQKKAGHHQKILKSALIIGIVSLLISGFFWYFRILRGVMGAITDKSYMFLDRGDVYPYIITKYTYVSFEGWLLILLSAIGLSFILLKPKRLKEIRYQFLIIYLATILFIIEVLPELINFTWHSASIYIFAYLTLPLAMLASYAIFTVLSGLFRGGKGQTFNVAFTLMILAAFMFNISLLNYATEEKYVKWFTTEFDQGNYKFLFFRHYYTAGKPMSSFQYDAGTWISENTPPGSKVIVESKYPLYLSEVFDRRRIFSPSKLNISNSSPTEIIQKTYFRSKGSDLYVFINLKNSSFSSETLALIAQDPNFKLVYQNPKVKIYKVDSGNFEFIVGVEVVEGIKPNKYTVKGGEEVTISYEVKNTGSNFVFEGHLYVHDLSNRKLFTSYSGMPYRLKPNETVRFEHTLTVSRSIPNGKYRVHIAMWDLSLGKWAPVRGGEKGTRAAAYIEVIS